MGDQLGQVQAEGKFDRWKVLTAVFLASLSFSVTMQVVAPVLPLIIREFQLSHAEAGLIASLFALPMVFLSIPIGVLSDRHGPKLTGLIALTLAIAGTLLVAFSPVYPLLLLGRALAGIGSLTVILISPHFISQWFAGKELGLAMGLWNSSVPLGTITSFATMGSIGQALGWRAPVFISVGITALALVIFAALARSKRESRAQTRSEGQGIGLFQMGLPIWLVGLAWMFYVAATNSYLTFGPDYFQSSGYTMVNAGVFTGALQVGSLILGPWIGVLIDRGLNRILPIAFGGVCLALAFILLPTVPSQIIPLIVLLAIGNCLVPIAIYSLPSRYLSGRKLGLGFGLLSSLMNAGVFLGPLASGAARDISGSYFASFVIMSMLGAMIPICVLPLRWFEKSAFTRRQTEG